jgi:acyl-CoA thioester hydrolase/thioesterase-3
MNTIFSSEIKVRPDDIDLNNHLHNAKYLDYVMEEFIEKGYNWVASAANINWKRPLKLGDTAIVKTQMDSVNGAQCRVNFWIENKATNKLVSEGHFIYTMVSVKSGRPVRITDEIIERYSI